MALKYSLIQFFDCFVLSVCIRIFLNAQFALKSDPTFFLNHLSLYKIPRLKIKQLWVSLIREDRLIWV